MDVKVHVKSLEGKNDLEDLHVGGTIKGIFTNYGLGIYLDSSCFQGEVV
jgi:hypothetical protein